jgi:lipoprotein-anchoring transpeptidase ErfK/SrfK
MAGARLNRRLLLSVGSAIKFASLPGQKYRAERLKVPRNHGDARKRMGALPTGETPATILTSNSAGILNLVLDGQRVARYRISTGGDGFSWTGVVAVGQ